jgi:hypothetical protein
MLGGARVGDNNFLDSPPLIKVGRSRGPKKNEVHRS